MDQEDTLDFKALRAKFQEEDHLLKQPKMKPAVPDKPKLIHPPPPQSPTHYLPAGARPSLLTSLSQSMEGRTAMAPRVVFKEDKKEDKKADKKEDKKPLIQITSKAKDKSEGKLKKSKDKITKGTKEKPDEVSADQKPKKEKKLPLLPLLSVAPKEKTAELVPAVPPPPPKASTLKKKGFLGFRKSPKSYSFEVPADPILDSPSSDLPGPAPLVPAPTDFSEVPPEPEYAAPKALLPKILTPKIPTVPDSSAAMETAPPVPDFAPPLVFLPDIPAPELPTPGETPPELEPPALPVSRPASQNEFLDPPSAAPTPPPTHRPPPVASSPSPSPSPPEPEAEAVNMAEVEAEEEVQVEASPPPETDPGSNLSSPKDEAPISPILLLSRAEDMSPVKKMSPCDLRVFNALEKARKKISMQTNHTRSVSSTPPPEDLSPSSTQSFPDLPPIDYEGNAFPPKPVNGFDHMLKGITEEGPELLLAPPPPPKRVIPDPETLGPAPEKPSRPRSVNLNRLPSPPPHPPPEEDDEIPAPPEFSETDTTDVPEFDDVASDAHSHSDWGNGDYEGPVTPDGQKPPEAYSNGTTPPSFGGPYHDDLPTDTSSPITQDSPPLQGLKDQVDNGVYESTENMYEAIHTSAAKKKGKTDGGKKRKGPPKNPYAEAQQETSEEKSKTGRFGKNDKKLVTEGPDEKELKKREKQRLEKEKKELKEKQEREKKEQKEREKKENEMKKKFKITGHEDAMYQAKVTVTNKGRKNDLPVTSGDIVSIIRTTNCPKGKWLARDCSSNYGYIAVDHVELDIQEMLELGKKAAITRMSSNNIIHDEASNPGNRASGHYPTSAESFTDDSEEWTADDDDTISLSPGTAAPQVLISHSRTHSMPDMGNKELSANHQHSRSDINPDGTHVHARHEALQKLATFFHSPKPVEPAARSEPEKSPVVVQEKEVALPEVGSSQEMDFDPTDMLILPPPDLYADLTVE